MSPIGHLDIRVADLDAAALFYEALLPAMGFTQRHHGGGWMGWATEDAPPQYVAITQSEGHVANENRIAFSVPNATEVDRVAEIAGDAGALLSGPKAMPYGPGYYAAYFDDPSGNRLEVYVRPV